MMRALLPWVIGVGLTAGFWTPLLTGAGFLGGDVYNYFMPLKTCYAEGLKAGEIRFWHPKIGNGVSVLGESQTGVFYPFHLIAYRLLDVVPAYNAVFLAHTVMAFVFFVWLARHNGLSATASLFGAGAFTFGWFAPRACLEWAVVTGCWFPLDILLAQRWLETGRRRWGWLLAVVFCVQLSAGHFQLAWVGMVGVGLFSLIFSWRAGSVSDRSRTSEMSTSPASSLQTLVADAQGSRVPILGLVGFLLAGVLWSAPQLLPTWELKQLSKRSEAGFTEEVSYGRIPPKYLLQLIYPKVYEDPDGWLRWAGGDSNRIEAHFSLGLAPLALLVFGWRARGFDGRQWRWALLTALALLLATGLPFVILKHLPGFSFFRYPGRYSLIAALFGALLVAAALDRLRLQRWTHILVAVVVGGLAFGEFYWASRKVGYVVMTYPAPLARVKDSEIFRRLTPQDRILAPDGNTLAVGPSAHVPPYIGLEPALYHSIWSRFPDVFSGEAKAETPIVKTLQRIGVTHLLTLKPLPDGWPTTLLWGGVDPFLHPRMGRTPSEPFWLYRFDASHGRMWMEPLGRRSANPKTTPVEFTVDSNGYTINLPPLPEGGRICTTEWAMQDAPGRLTSWSAIHDGNPLHLERAREKDVMSSFVVVDLPANDRPTSLVIRYRPTAFYQGLYIAVGVLILCVVLEWRLRRKDG